MFSPGSNPAASFDTIILLYPGEFMRPDPRLMRLAKDSRFWLILTITLGLLSGLLTIGQARAVSSLVSRVFLEGFGLSGVRNLFQLIFLIFTIRAVLSWLSSLSSKTIAVQVKNRVRKMLLEHIQRLGPGFLQKERSGELTNTVVEGVEALDAYYSQYLPQLVLAALVPLTILIFVFPMDLLSGLVLLVTFPLIPFFMFLIGRTSRSISDRQYGILSRLSAQFLDSLQGLTTLKLFNRARAQTEAIAETSDRYRQTTMKVLQVTFLSALALELLATISTAVVAVQIGLRLLYYRIGFEQAFFLLIIAPEFYIPMRLLGLRYHAGMDGQSAAERIFSILNTKPLWDPGRANEFTSRQISEFKSLEFSALEFTYPGEARPALEDISFQIQAGEQIALVGESGSGKSTIASLILGFFPPGKGQLIVNGTELQPDLLADWRSQIAWVPQQPALIPDSIAANIRLARPEADFEAVARAARAAHLDAFIESLPDRYETRIGEGGARLSGGQAQRLALARAFLKDAPVLIMDEPTSQLDPITESLLADSTRELMKNRTVLTIAHRLNTIFQADRILVLKSGKLVESGTHQELILQDAVYAGLVQAYTGGETEAAIPQTERVDSLYKPGRDQLVEEKPQTLERKRRIWIRLLGFLRPFWLQILFSVFLGFLTIGSSVGLMGSSAWLISTAALHPSIAELGIAIVGVRFFGILRGIARYLERLTSHNVTFEVLTRLRVWFFEALVPLAPARLQRYRSGDLLGRIISDIKTLEDFYIRSIAPPLVAVLIGAGTAVFIGGYHPLGSWILASFFILIGLFQPLIVRLLASNPGRELVQTRSRLGTGLVNFIQGLPDWLVFGQADQKQSKLSAEGEEYSRVQISLTRINGLNEGLFTFFSNLAMWLVLLTAVPLVETSQLSGVMLATLALMTLVSFEAVQTLPQAMETFASSLEAGVGLFDVVDARPAVLDPAAEKRIPAQFDLQIKELSFRYPGTETNVLNQISFQIQPGEITALVGPSGSGKSTLLNLLLRFWEYQTGEIRLGGRSLQDLSQEKIRERFSVVSQSGTLFYDTIQANLALARPSAALDEIISAARKARIHDLIQSLPDGYQTLLGERGQRFSAGEQQRIRIARAVLKDAPFFLLDEPTANLDPITEKEILTTVFDLLQEKTALLVTHRLVRLNRADQILVLDQGRIIEAGTEAELLALKGFYHQMWSQQNRILSFA